MSDDRDLAALLPDPPPARPAQRDATIAAAMARFDGVEAPPPPRRSATSSIWATLRRPQWGVALTACLVAVVAMPVWFSGDPRVVPAPVSAPAPRAEQPAAPATPVPTEAAQAAAEPAAPPAERLADAAPKQIEARPGSADRALAEAPPPADERMAKSAVGGIMAAPAPAPAMSAPPPPPPPATMAAPQAVAPARVEQMADAREDFASNIVVTGTHRARMAARPAPREDSRVSRRRPGSACTVDDPNKRIGDCTRLLERAVRNADARAHVAEGLSKSWAGDSAGAIAAFDQAIAVAPGSGFAYLNRGLAHRRSGNAARAQADLDRAARLDPDYRAVD